jgi:hypothetical protein
MFPSHPPVEIHDNHVESFTDMLHQEKPMLHGNKRTTGKNSLLQKKHTMQLSLQLKLSMIKLTDL